ncbi:BTB domain-containing protein [Oryctes borbonicus]|uniref:BTB domain-containing protein n=1 Tax=Oryctes borbonicus TaxID=1629725 RepID=A0A0T6AXP5_9SCAR|nr:BTB domain-containing protein [Oryctes borbonicus]
MSSSQLYNLTWGEYGTSLISAVQLLRCQDELVDVTLAAGGRTFHAHKVVLCAASPFLLDLLKKAQDLVQSQISLSQDEESILKRKKRAKRMRSPTSQPQSNKWSKTYVQTDGNGSSMTEQQESASSNWTQQMNLVNVSSSTAALTNIPLHTPILVQNIPVSVNNTGQSPAPKVRGASDQPGTCPLCGAMLRQARNLRRHLITSCKYRSISNQSNMLNTQHVERTSNGTLHQLQTIPLQNVERVSQNIERIDSKQMALTPISCSDLLPSTSNIMSSSLQ